MGLTLNAFASARPRQRGRLMALMMLRGVSRMTAFWAERKLRRAIVDLNAQDDFVLLDLGIRRDQIEAAVREGRFDLERPHLAPTRH
jgi:uncharacterized protein YjiS (DUF1127 family)